MMPPPKMPIRYGIKYDVSPATSAGPKVRAGFSEAPVAGPPARMLAASVKPMATPASLARAPEAAAWNTALTRKKVRMAS